MQALWQGDELVSCDQSLIERFSADRALAYGDGVFATMKTAQGQLCWLETHLQRLSDGAARLGFAWQPSTKFIAHIQQLAQTQPNHCFKLYLSRGVGGRGYAAPALAEPLLLLSIHALPTQYPQWRETGVTLAISPIQLSAQPWLAGMKHGNRLEQVLIKSQNLPNGVDEWLVVDQLQQMIGVGSGNVFFIKDKQVVVPKHSHAGISGVMRQQIIIALLEMGYDVRACHLPLSQLIAFDFVLISNSLMELVPVTCIHSTQAYHWSIWPELTRLRQQLHMAP